MVKTPRNTRHVPISNNLFATNTGDVTLIGPDDQVWQGARPAGSLRLVSNQAERYKDGAAPAMPARDHVGEYALGSNQQLFESVRIGQDMYKWQRVENKLADSTNGFILPAGRQEVARLDPAAIDAEGVILRIFVGSLACYKRADALPVFWDGFDMFDIDGRYLHVPEKFKRGIPSTMGLEGIIYIPQEEYLEDLLISIEEQEMSFPPEYHKRENFDKIGVRPADGRHINTQRKVGHQDARACFESAWDAAVFEITDVFTKPDETFAERRNMLETFLKPLKDAYKQIRLIPVMPILSQEWAISAYENTPVNANLVIIDPESKYEHPVGPRDRKDKPRRQFEKKEKASPLVGWKLDGSGKLEAVVVEGNNSQKSAVIVHPGQLWVDISKCADMAAYRRELTVALQKFHKAPPGCADNKVPMEFISRMKKAYEDDLNAQTRSYSAVVSHEYAFKARERAMKYIMNTLATKIWDFGNKKPWRQEFAGARVTRDLVTCIQKFALQGVRHEITSHAVLSQQVGELLARLYEQAAYGLTDMVTLMEVQIELRAPELHRMYKYNMVDPRRKEHVLSCLMKWGPILKTSPLGAAGVIDAERRTALADLANLVLSEDIYTAYRHTDQDFFATLSLETMERSMNIKPADLTTAYPLSARGHPIPMASGAVDISADQFKSLIEAIYEMAGIFMQGGHVVGPTFAVKTAEVDATSGAPVNAYEPPADSTEAKNLMAWGTTQVVNYQRAFPYGALISYKVQKGDEISGVQEEDTYTMTKVTIV